MFEINRENRLICAIVVIAIVLLVQSVSAPAPYFVETDLGAVYQYQGTNVRYIKAIDVTNTDLTQMKIVDSTNTKTIGSPTIGSVQRVFSSTTGTTHGVTVTVTGGADTSVNYNSVLNDYIYTRINKVPALYSKIPATTTTTEGVFLMVRANTSAEKEDIVDKDDLVLLQEAAYIYVAESPNRAILYKSVNPGQQGSISEGAQPYYNENNFGDTILKPSNNVSLDGYTSTEAIQGSVTEGQYSAVAMSYDGTNTFSIWGYVPTVILDGDRTLTWNGGAIPTSYTKNSGDVTLSVSDTTSVENITYLLIKSDETYDVKVTVDTDKLADHITTQWDSLSGTAPVMSNVLNKILLQGVGTGATDPYTYSIAVSGLAFPSGATTWSDIAITSGYGISGTASANNAVVPNADLNTLVAGTYYVYAFAVDADLIPKAFDRQTITINNAPAPTPTPGGGGGGGGGGGVVADTTTTPVTVSTRTGELTTNADGVVQNSIEVDASDGVASVDVPAGIQAFDANGQPLSEITINTIKESASAERIGLLSGTGYDGGTYFNVGGMVLVYECGPPGATFSSPVDIVFQLTEEEYNSLGPNQQFSVEYYDETTNLWVSVDTYVNPVTHQVIGQTTHFSIFALMVQESAEIQETATATPVTGTTTTTTTTTTTAGEGTSIWTWALIIVIIIAIIGVGWWYYNNKQ